MNGYSGDCFIFVKFNIKMFVTCYYSSCYAFISSGSILYVEAEQAKADVEDDMSQGSEGRSDSNGQSSTPGQDSDHDYTIIGSSSPTHTEDRWVERFSF